MANKQTRVEWTKPVDGNRVRVPAHITESQSSAFGVEVQVNRHLTRMQEAIYPSGHGSRGDQHGQSTVYVGAKGPIQPGNQNYREVIPPGKIGTQENWDVQLPPPQYVDTVAWDPGEDKCPKLHGAMASIKYGADRPGVPFSQYGDFQPRSAPLPRAAQDDVSFGRGDTNQNTSVRLAADPLMTDGDSFTLFGERDLLRKDLYGTNVDGFLHNSDMQSVRIGQNAANGAPAVTKGKSRIGATDNPPTSATGSVPPSAFPVKGIQIPTPRGTRTLPKRSMPVQGATRAKRGSS